MARRRLIEGIALGISDNNGNPLASGKVYTYDPGTTSSKATYSTSTTTTPNANPVVLDAYGRGDIYTEGNTKLVIKDSADNTLKTIDPSTLFDDSSGNLYGGISSGAANVYSLTPSAYSVSSYTDGLTITFKSHQTNTSGTVTTSIGSLSSKSIVRLDDTSLGIGDIISGYTYTLVYSSDLGKFIIINHSNGYYTYNPTITGYNTMTISASTINTAVYWVEGKNITLCLDFVCTTGGVATNAIFATYPVAPVESAYLAAPVLASGVTELGQVNINASRIELYRAGSVNWALAANQGTNRIFLRYRKA